MSRSTAWCSYGSYPASRIMRTDLKAASISGSADGLSTLADIEESRGELPAQTTYVVVPTGPRTAGSETTATSRATDRPTGDRAAAQATITEATQALLVSLTPPPPPRRNSVAHPSATRAPIFRT